MCESKPGYTGRENENSKDLNRDFPDQFDSVRTGINSTFLVTLTSEMWLFWQFRDHIGGTPTRNNSSHDLDHIEAIRLIGKSTWGRCRCKLPL